MQYSDNFKEGTEKAIGFTEVPQGGGSSAFGSDMYRSTALNPNPNFVDTKFCTKTNKRTVPSFGQAQQMDENHTHLD